MPTPPNPIAKYQSRRKDLADQLANAKSKAAIEQLQRALFVTDVTAATLQDISAALQTLASATRAQADKHLQEIAAAKTDLEVAVEDLASSGAPALEYTLSLLARLAHHKANSAAQGFEIAFLQWDLLSAVGSMWLENLEHLYGEAGRAAFFARIEKLLEFAASKLPVVGDILDILKVATEVYAAKKLQAKNADEYFASLESYFDAGNLYLIGVLSFCAQVESLISGTQPPTQAQIEDRLARHIESVATRTHPASENF